MATNPQLGADQTIEGLRSNRSTFEGINDRFRRNVNDTRSERQRLQAGASSAIAQSFRTRGAGGPRGFANQLSEATRRAKARTGIANRGEAAIKNQQLRDRLSLTQQAGTRVGQVSQVQGAAARLRTSLEFAKQDASDARQAGVAGAIGGIAGGAASFFSNRDANSFDFSLPGQASVQDLDIGTAGTDLAAPQFSPLGFAEQLNQPGLS